MRRSVLRTWSCLLAVVCGVACDESDARFTTSLAAGFSPAGQTVSVLGVYRDGAMSLAAWDALAPRIAPVLHAQRCEAGYDELRSGAPGAPGLADAVDEFAREDGPTDDLLAQLSPAAGGDLVLVMTVAGSLPEPKADAGAAPAGFPASSARMRPGRRGFRPSRSPQPERSADPAGLELTADVFSVAQKRSVATIAMRYSGASVSDAVERFAAKLGQTFASLVCAGWHWEAPIDPERIRQSVER